MAYDRHVAQGSEQPQHEWLGVALTPDSSDAAMAPLDRRLMGPGRSPERYLDKSG